MHIEINRQNITDKKKNCAVILYGSRYGDNMKSFGPKFLYKDYYGKPIIETQIRVIKDALPSAEILVVAGYASEKVIKYKQQNVRIIENQLYQTHNDIEDIRLALNNTCREHIVAISSDIFFNKHIFNNLFQHSCIVYDDKHQLHDSQLGVQIIDNKATYLDFDNNVKWCHISYFENKHLQRLNKLCMNEHESKYLFEIINKMLLEGYKFNALEPNNMKVHKIDKPTKLKTHRL